MPAASTSSASPVSSSASAAACAARPELRGLALLALIATDPDDKIALTRQTWAVCAVGTEADAVPIAGPSITTDDLTCSSPLPGRPARPELRAHLDVPKRSPFTPEGLAALLHAVTHIEFNAINLALDAVWRFAGMPRQYYIDWMQVAVEEALHFSLLRDHLRSLGHDYGNFPAHTGLWDMTEKTSDDVLARMALVPRTLEARGLDATPPMQAKLRKVGTPAALRAVDILDIILRDEIGHVAIGNHWYRHLCEQRGLEPMATYAMLAAQYGAPRLKGPLNLDARRSAGFTEAEILRLSAAD